MASTRLGLTVVGLSLLAAGCSAGHVTPATRAQPSAASPVAGTAAPAARPTPAPTDTGSVTITVSIQDGKVVAGPRRAEVRLGQKVTLEVTTDVSDEIHVHGYDEEARTTYGAPALIRFAATIPGIFEVELHHLGLKILEIEVR